MQKFKAGLTSLFVVAATGLASTASAAFIEADAVHQSNTVSTPNFGVSSTDLINGVVPVLTGNVSGLEGTNKTGSVLTDGTVADPVTRDTAGAFQFSTFLVGGNNGVTSATFVLPSTSNIASIVVSGGWQDLGRDQQSYTVLASLAGTPTVFDQVIGTVNYNPADTLTAPQTAAGHPSLTQVTLTGSLSNVAAIQFNFNATENGYSGYDEIDVNGTAVPEPASLGVLGLGGLGLLARRRRA